MRKPKILFLVQLPPPVHGVSVMNELTVDIIENKDNYDHKKVALNYTKTIRGIGKFSLSKLVTFFKVYFKIIKTVFLFRPDLTYFTITPTGTSFYRDLMIVMLLKLFNTKITYHMHGKGINATVQKSKILRIIYKWVFNKSYVIHLSKSLLNDISLVDTSSKTFVLPNGIQKEKENKKRFYRDYNGSKKLLFLSNLAENKGVIMFLNSCCFLKSKGIDFEANIVGKETTLISEEQFYERIQDLQLQDKVKYLGPKYGAQKEKILSQNHVFVYPTYNDCFPLVLIEALKFGLPVISTKEGAIPEIVDNGVNGFIVERKDQKDLNEKLFTLLSDEKQVSYFAKEAEKKFKNTYTLDHYKQNVLRIFKEILDD